MPFANEIVIIELTGAEVLQALTRSIMGNLEDEDGGFLQVAGIRFVVRGKVIAKPVVGKEKEPLRPEKIYQVAVPDFLAAGGDGYKLFIDKPSEYTGLPLCELIVDTIRSRKVIESRVDGRIVRVSN